MTDLLIDPQTEALKLTADGLPDFGRADLLHTQMVLVEGPGRFRQAPPLGWNLPRFVNGTITSTDLASARAELRKARLTDIRTLTLDMNLTGNVSIKANAYYRTTFD